MSQTKQIEITEQLNKLISFYENLNPENLSQLSSHYAQDACFKDPFNDVKGLANIETIFIHMFKTLKAPQFLIKDLASQGTHSFLTWDFQFELEQMPSKGPMTIKGATHLTWIYDHQVNEWRVSLHRDYWDAAEEIYEKLPLLGVVVRWVKSKMSAHL